MSGRMDGHLHWRSGALALAIALASPAAGTAATDRDPPCSGVRVMPGADVQALVDASPEGATFCFEPGIYRLSDPLWPRPRQRFIGRPGVVISGARRLPDFMRLGNYWVADHSLPPTLPAGRCSPATYLGCAYPHTVYVDGRGLRRATSLIELSAGGFYLDYPTGKIFLADDPSGRDVELSVAAMAATGVTGVRDDGSVVYSDGVVLRDLTFEMFANPAQNGVISTFGARGWVIASNEVRLSHGCGIWAGSGAVVRDNHVHHNGQIGLCGQGDDIEVSGNEIAFNNTAGFDPRWEAGGAKWSRTRDLRVLGNYVHHNEGPGLWTDFENAGTLYADNVVIANAGEGIFHEVSHDAVIRNNLVRDNDGGGLSPWGAGIQISGSHDVVVSNNVVEDNENGIVLIQEERGSGTHGPWRIRDVTVRHNDVKMGAGHTGAADLTGDDLFWSDRGIRFVGNDYRLANDGPYFWWRGAEWTMEAWIAFGMDG